MTMASADLASDLCSGPMTPPYSGVFEKVTANATHFSIEIYNESDPDCSGQVEQVSAYKKDECNDGFFGSDHLAVVTAESFDLLTYDSASCSGNVVATVPQMIGLCTSAWVENAPSSTKAVCEGGQLVMYKYNTTSDCTGPSTNSMVAVGACVDVLWFGQAKLESTPCDGTSSGAFLSRNGKSLAAGLFGLLLLLF
ncbi:unnamed protein product [Symbiodinium sp. CCMP2592]|nr:unnamed protein product [Symbiodinium sp. CCMP2592]